MQMFQPKFGSYTRSIWVLQRPLNVARPKTQTLRAWNNTSE